MKRLSFTKSLIALCALGILLVGSTFASAQNARVQIIHNAAGIALDTVDVYVNGTPFQDIQFRSATSLLTLPAGTYALNINSATSADSGDQVLARLSFSVAANSGNVIMVTGVEDTTLYATNPNNRNRGVQLIHRKNVVFTSSNAANVSTTVIHGVTDAPGVNITTRPTSTTLNLINVRYGDTTTNLFIPAQPTFIDIKLNSTGAIVKSYLAPFNGKGSKSQVVFASGFLTPAANQNGADFKLFTVDTNGGAAVEIPEGFRTQFVHNSADVSVHNVDVWMNTTKVASNLAFKSASPMLSFTEGTYDVTYTRSGSPNKDSMVLVQLTGQVLDGGSTYLAVLNGVIDTTLYTTNPEGNNRSITINGSNTYTETGTAGNATLWYFNGIADQAKTTLSRGTTAPVNLYTDITYGNISGPVSIATTASTAYVLSETVDGNLIRTFRLKLNTSVASKVGTLFSTGYTATAGNPAGAVLSSYYIVYTDGTIQPIEELNAFVQFIHASADTTIRVVDVYVNGTKTIDDFRYATATAFLPIVPYKTSVVKIAPSNSTTDASAFFTTNITADSSKYHYAIATGNNATGYALNPNAISTAFTVVLNNQALTSSVIAKNVDLMYFHSITDASATEARGANQIQFLSKNNKYKEFHGYRSHAALDDSYFELKTSDSAKVLYAGYGDFASYEGKAGLVFASGFVTPQSNKNGPGVVMYVAWPDGNIDTFGIFATGIEHNAFDKSSFRMYPNPAHTLTTLEFNSNVNGTATTEVYDLTGKLVSHIATEVTTGEVNIHIPLTELHSGMYFVKVALNGQSFTHKLLVN